MSGFVYIFSVVAAIAASAAFVYVIITGLRELLKKDKCPVETVKATIVSKRQGDSIASGKATAKECFAVFKIQNGEEKELRLTQTEYDSVKEGDRGILIFRGNALLSFEIKREDQ